MGNHTSPSIHKYLYQPVTQDIREERERKNAQALARQAQEMNHFDCLISEGGSNTSQWHKSKETLISMEHGTYIPVETSVPDKPPPSADEEDDEESMDWWTKYFASLDTMIEVSVV